MIVNYINEGWEVIFQQSHGMLAAQIGSYIKEDLRPKRWLETILAIANHDDQQVDWQDKYHLSEVGAPVDFTLKEFSLEQASRVTQSASYKSRWVGLLISMHASFLYEPLRGQKKAIDKFLDVQIKNQKKWQKELEISENEAKRSYDLVQWCDRCSLILCKTELPTDRRKLEIYSGLFNKDSFMFFNENKSINVYPWPFITNKFNVSVESRSLSQLKFKTDKDLFEALDDAITEEKSWTFSKV